MKSVKIVCILLLASIFMSATHPFHASITQCKLNDQNQNLEITIRVFTDDLAMAINEEVLVGEDQSESQNTKIRDYVSGNFSITDESGKKIQMNAIGQEAEYDITFIYFEIEDFKKLSSYEVSQTMLFDQFEDQTNIVNLVIGGETYSDYFTPTSTSKTYEIK